MYIVTQNPDAFVDPLAAFERDESPRYFASREEVEGFLEDASSDFRDLVVWTFTPVRATF